MSDAMYPVRLWWSHERGVARCDGVHIDLHRAPALPNLPELTEIDFAPNIVGLVRVACDAMRDLTHDEAHDALELLQRMARGAHGCVEGGTS